VVKLVDTRDLKSLDG